MDRSILEGDPHAILEGMTIMAYAVGAHHGYIYIRAEYPIAVSRLRIAIAEAEELGFLGRNIFNSGFDFDLEIRLGAGAFVCGEETALIASIEGRRGMPTPKPPFPAVSGVWGKPTSINNVETIANVAMIMRKGAEWYSSIGTDKSKGTRSSRWAERSTTQVWSKFPWVRPCVRSFMISAAAALKARSSRRSRPADLPAAV
jgi:NADH:ubiquinone oxidoreductase subunit F (NADH-binding)